MPGKVSKLLCSNFCRRSTIPLLNHFSTIRNGPIRRGERRYDASEDDVLRKLDSGYEENDQVDERKSEAHFDPPNPIPNRPLRGERRTNPFKHEKYDDNDEKMKPSLFQVPRTQFQNRPMGGRGSGGRSKDSINNNDLFTGNFNLGGSIDNDENRRKQSYKNPTTFHIPNKEEKKDDQSVDSFLEKFKLGDEKKESPLKDTPIQISKPDSPTPTDSLPQDTEEIFKKMKETGLIPNAVAMLDGLCKDGLVQEAMKLFGLMREKGTIPEVVIYTAVVEGFCKAQKLDDAKRIFRKMQNNGISPNAFSYTVLIQGLCKGRSLEDAVDFCVEMLEAGHSPNVATFASLVDCFCREKGMGEANSVIGRLREKGFFVNEKAVREYLDKKGPFSPLVWEAIFGKKSSQRSF